MRSNHFRRREVITLLGGAAFAWPRPAHAQQPAFPIIGFLGSRTSEESTSIVAAFRKGLGEWGYVEGRNIDIAFRWSNNQNDRLITLAIDLVHRGVSVIVAAGFPAALAAKTATATVPIIFTGGADPIQFGLAASVNRPGGNVTGVNMFSAELVPKQLQFLRELVPTATTIAQLVNPQNPVSAVEISQVQSAGHALGLKIEIVQASTLVQLEAAFGSLTQLGAGGLLIGVDPFFNARVEQLAALATQYSVPAMYVRREFAQAGGLMSYGTSITDVYRQVGAYAVRILNGEKPADLPVVQPIKFELVINLKTAKALGLTVPLTLQVAADEVIE